MVEKAHDQSTKKEGFKEYHRVKAKRTDAQIKSKQKRLEKNWKKQRRNPLSRNTLYTFQLTQPKKQENVFRSSAYNEGFWRKNPL